MKIIKKRAPKKKDVVESEEIRGIVHDISSKVGQTLERNRLIAVVSIALLVILSGAGVAYYYLAQKWDQEASLMENSAYNYYLEGNYKEALSKYQEIVTDYSSTKSMPVAMYYTGNSHLGLGQTDQAIEAYQKFIEKCRDQDTTRPLVYMNLGYAYMNKKDYSNALSAFKEASTLKNSLVTDRAIYEIARTYEITGDKVSAIEKYESLVKTFPNSPWREDAAAKLNKMQGSTGGAVKEQPQDKTDNTKVPNSQEGK